MTKSQTVKIGGASGFWGESMMATPQLLQAGGLDYIVYDYLAEITMSIMARARSKNPEAGYATDFVNGALKPNLKDIAAQGVKILSNAGGVNPQACGEAVRALIKDAGLNLKVAVVLGDDLLESAKALAESDYREMFSDEAFPDPAVLASINAYLGAFPVAKALAAGADIVITGRSVDSAVTLGACIHAFGWQSDEWDKLAGGSLAGHIIECGPQATGGNFTDWHLIAPRLDEIGYPVVEVQPDGSFVCTKPDDTGGLVSVGTVSEQMLYEIGDPQAYFLPDVVCDFSQVLVEEQGDNRVAVSGAMGYPASDTYKVCATYADGFRGGHSMSFVGFDADRKAEAFADALFKRSRKVLRASNLPDFTETSVEVIGADSQYGAARKIQTPREVALKFAAKHSDSRGIGVLLKEATGLALATPPGLSGFAGSRPKPSPLVRLFSFLLPKPQIAVHIDMEGEQINCEVPAGQVFEPHALKRPHWPETADASEPLEEVPLVKLAWGRSGDKGNSANIGIIARDASYVSHIAAALSEDAVAEYFAHFLEGEVKRFYLPGSHAINFVLHSALGGGGIASLRNDSQGKAYAQLLLDYAIPIPRSMAEAL